MMLLEVSEEEAPMTIIDAADLAKISKPST
jgi:hypothetical protein